MMKLFCRAVMSSETKPLKVTESLASGSRLKNGKPFLSVHTVLTCGHRRHKNSPAGAGRVELTVFETYSP